MGELPPSIEEIVNSCRQRAVERFHRYGANWIIMRPTTLTDLLFIKASRIRTIEERGKQLVGEDTREDFMALVNYAIMELIVLSGEVPPPSKADEQWFVSAYDQQIRQALTIMAKKNHDYGNAWRQMRPTSFTDLILSKLARIKQMEDQTSMRDHISAELYDIINYALFALIRLTESNESR